ncbi:TetR/AcrR family transcriptional regulator [Natrarchaeobius oligotrophus]|uniref:TetR family transcriptional regulator n=1 Tax=Natrarchaeobius chitinivorans TaxID=1679083 RepID=A0A3N6MGU8_NATCH|nr:TetR/AcrR family transcriptional regulator [Natrarchaeobius chitinivorans]RQH03314.1 TetR family transcriptional regulator [Natrarchaeobius chitinivorans]
MTAADVRNAIMDATYQALCERGYTDLTTQDIADRTDRSKSLLFYHYDSKEDIVVDFLEYLLEQFDERAAGFDDRPPIERLATFLDWYLYGSDEDDRRSFHAAMLELRTQAPYNSRYREQLRKIDDRLRSTLEDILNAGVDDGQFVDHDSEETAALLIAAIDGARVRQLTLDRGDYLDAVRSATIARIIDELLVDGVSFPTERPPNDGPSFRDAVDPIGSDVDDSTGP